MISRLANAMPRRIAALPHALLKVFSTIRFGCSLSVSRQGFCAEKSEYASSTITMPRNLSITFCTSAASMLFPVGLLGEHIQMILVCVSHAASSFSALIWKCSSSNTGRYSTSLMSAQTLYMPYVGSMATTLSIPGRVKQRYGKSMASSLPFPKKICSTATPFTFASFSFTCICSGSG